MPFSAPRAADSPAATEPTREVLSFAHLDGWVQDDHAAALATYLRTCDCPDNPAWKSLGPIARDCGDARGFFETHFQPVIIGGTGPAFFTGYYEPKLNGAPRPDERFRFPLYARPDDLPERQPWATRAEIEEQGLLAGRGLEIAWLDDPAEIFFLQVQGSGRIRFPDGRVLRVGYSGTNGHGYRSIGQELIRRGVFDASEISAQAIKDWVRNHPAEGQVLLCHNPSYVFFRAITGSDATDGPIGALNRPVTAGRSIAVDPAVTPLGAPVWIEKEGAAPMRRLMIAQDTGSAIKGPQRADIFYGTGEAAGHEAGQVRDAGRMIVLLPVGSFGGLVEEG